MCIVLAVERGTRLSKATYPKPACAGSVKASWTGARSPVVDPTANLLLNQGKSRGLGKKGEELGPGVPHQGLAIRGRAKAGTRDAGAIRTAGPYPN